ncbi:tyrosine phosphatase family protein [Sinorhizobium medicae]|uniref:Protein-tyrosine-phosphatase n=1 Tax=Sinorhizobium medicae TaxID=110321 RepID=A0A6G1WKA7_9HYPH|nr:protein-tyrosine-phosphatase [Sinorhizobium medicae]MBO1945422.1 protein-tyrosine-phosphatase [Sinorhizobium medicae]MDX0404785.1 protein-tyrosine-phosphatase [Sinorhizobium medicae]MDX0411778.1 protein-tyrosine-phosphatase [Sinorhizobium medicae]MDX0416905.1 protein-tyrosine-phosphatase [Sinorhizobium medicae]MDX0424252.1 protein-tyrosine-phosphatase [Sinorhizobium medicae]
MALVPELTICGIHELPAQSARNVTHVLSIVDPDHPELDAFETYGKHNRTTLRFHDIIVATRGQVMPAPEHVEAILRFGADHLAREDRGAPSHVLVHCHMGISRSTAAMLALMAQANPDEEAESLFARLVGIRPQAWPNSLMVGFADEQLGRDGALLRALSRHYGRQIKTQPQFSDWMTSLNRSAELAMARFD